MVKSPPTTDPPAEPVPKASLVRYGVLASFCALALIAYIQRNSISVAEAEIRLQLGLSKQMMGWVISSFFLTYAVCQIPTGYLGQYWGTRKSLSVFACCGSLVAGGFALVFQPWLLVAARCGMGAMQAGIFPAAVNSVSRWMPESRRSVSNGMLGGFMSVGGAVGVALTGLLLPLIGWRAAFLLYCIPGLIFSVWFYWWFRDSPADHAGVNDAELDLLTASKPTNKSGVGERVAEDNSAGRVPWGTILTNRSMLALCGQQVFRAAGAMFFASWFATYLRETREVDVAVAGVLTSLPILAVVFGSPLGGVLSDWIFCRTGSRSLSRRGVAAMAMFVCAMLVIISFQFANPWVAVLLISLGSFFAAFAGPCAYTATIDVGGKHVPLVFATMNMAGNLGAFMFPIIVPWLLDENELYVDKLQFVSRRNAESVAEIIVEAESAVQSNVSVVKNFGEKDASVTRFHHSKSKTLTLFAEYVVTTNAADQWTVAVTHAGRKSPPLGLSIDGKRISTDKMKQQDTDELQTTVVGAVTLSEGEHTIQIETTTAASGNWNLVLAMFAGIYLAACLCWLFVNNKSAVEAHSGT